MKQLNYKELYGNIMVEKNQLYEYLREIYSI